MINGKNLNYNLLNYHILEMFFASKLDENLKKITAPHTAPIK